MGEKYMDSLVSLVSALGWRPEVKTVLGTDTDTFYDALIEKDPVKAYEIACSSGDPAFVAAVTERVIQKTVGGTDLEGTIREMYLNTATGATVPELVRPLVSSSGFSIESLADRYRLHNVLYDGVASVVDISKALLDNGASHTQSDWIETTRQGEWKLPSGPLYFAVLAALYDNKDSCDVNELRKMFANDFKSYFMMTSTRIDYVHNGLDIVVHDVGYTTKRTEKTDIVGVDGYINEASGFGATMKALVGIDDCHKIGRVGSWISEKNPYLWRINSKPKKDIERALVLDDDDGRFVIDASDGLGGSRPARGMVVRGAENSP